MHRSSLSSSWAIRRFVPSNSQHRKSSGSGTPSARAAPCLLDWKEHNHDHSAVARFNVMTFNMLAPVYKRLQSMDLQTGNRKREVQNQELWRGRAQRTAQFLRDEVLGDTDILGLQEFWLDPQYLSFFQKDFQTRGYDLRHLQRTGGKLDGLLIAVKKSAFKVLGSQNVFLCNLSDRIALIVWLQHLLTGKHVIVANTHLSFPHSALDKLSQMRQMKTLTQSIQDFAVANHISTTAARIVMGDFNVEASSPVCEHLRTSGYASCFEVSSPHPHTLSHNHIDTTTSSNSSSSRARSSGRPPRSPLKFVSHRNHQEEELGVDHIFVRSEAMDQHIQTSHGRPVNVFHPPDSTPQSSGSASTTTSSSEAQLHGDRIFVDNCRVLPQRVPCTEWDREFNVSDHRPVCATLLYAHHIVKS